jgi:manganese efflux pump family protein
MSLLVIAGISFALGCDAFAVGLALGTRSLCSRASFRLWFHFGLFQFLMPIIGWGIGTGSITFLSSTAPYISSGLLFAIAAKMLYESLNKDETAEAFRSDPTRGWSLIGLSIATSLDALGVGFSMGLARSNLLLPAVCIGITAGVMTWVGVSLGRRLSHGFGKRVETFGAVILFLIGFKLAGIP